jgi:hypothetical protein
MQSHFTEGGEGMIRIQTGFPGQGMLAALLFCVSSLHGCDYAPDTSAINAPNAPFKNDESPQTNPQKTERRPAFAS